MNKLLLTSAFALAIGASPAHAANTALILWNAADPLGFEAATGTGSADVTATNLDGVTVTLSFVSRATNPNQLTEGNINIDNTTGSVQTLNLIAGANGYLGPSTDFKLTGTIGVTSGVADLTGQYFVDGADTLNGQTESVVGTNIKTFDSGLLTGPFSFSANNTGFDHVLGPYGMAEELSLTLQPGAAIFVQGASMTAAVVPEPRTWIMLLAGFGVMAWAGLRRQRRERLAPLA